MDLKAHLGRICELHGPSGYEAPIREALRADWQPLVDSFEEGVLGGLTGIKRGSGAEPHRRIMLCAHMDEIGLIVRNFDEGFLLVSHLGGIDPRVLPGMPVMVHCDPPLRGVVGVPPLYTLTDDQRTKYAPLTDLLVDVGLPAEEVCRCIHVGDVVTLDIPITELQNGRLTGKALDDRACIAIVTACLDALQTRKHRWDVLAVASVQEETGGAGAMTEAYRLNPDLAIALDVTFGTQPGVSEGDFPLGGGAVISLGANFHPALYDAIRAAGDRLEMALATDPLPMHSGTDAWPIQVSRDGIPTALLEVAIRNMHTPVETVDIKDIERAGRILAEFISALDADFLSTIVWDKEVENSPD